MAKNDVSYAKSQLSRFDPHFIQLGEVMDNRDPTRSGKLKVWIKNSQSVKSSKDSWITCRYSSSFAGRTGGSSGATSYDEFPKSYGFWAVPPDVGAVVAVFFVNGDIHNAYWFGCTFDDRMNTMIPGAATQVLSNSGYDMPVPITEFDRNSIQSTISEKYMNVPLIEGARKQNLLYDEQKGIPNRSSTRTTTNSVYGMNTPRGNSFILDDGFTDSELTAPSWDDDPDGYQNTNTNNPANDTRTGARKHEGIVMRTRSGAQILISESDGNIFIINRDGTARVELTADGQVTVLSDKSISMRSGEDINFSAAKNINFEAGADLNFKIGGNTKLELLGKLDIKVSGDAVINTGAELRLFSAGSTRVQSGADLNMSGSSGTRVSSDAVVDVKGSSVNITGSGSSISVASSVSSNAVFQATDFQTSSASLNGHIHVHAQWSDASNHSNEMAPAQGGGGTGSPTAAQPAQPANDVQPTTPQYAEVESVDSISTSPEVSQVLERDMLYDNNTVTYVQNLEGMMLVMPCTGTIRQNGYWGRKVPTDDGSTIDRYGWSIQCNGDVVAPQDGLITFAGTGGIIVTFRNGYKCIFYNVQPSVNNKAMVKKGDVIGKGNGVIDFEMRLASSALYGFSGTVDPGLFYSTVTDTGSNCANKTLQGGKVSNPNAKPYIAQSTPSGDSTEFVHMSKVNSIGGYYPQRGSKRSPNAVKRKASNTNNSSYPPEDLTSYDKTPADWKVEPSDATLLADLKQDEGSIAYQTAKGFFRNGKFYPYNDSRGFPTIGYGHLILPNENFRNGITEEEADAMLQRDVIKSVNGAKRIYADYKLKNPYIAQIVLVEMCFQMGSGKVREFKGTLAKLQQQDYIGASHNLLDSAWAKQTPGRAQKQARRIASCQ